MASALSYAQKPPSYILQSWLKEPIDLHEKYLLQQRFIIAPDATVPFSKLRQRFRNLYEERAKQSIIVHFDPWIKIKH